MRALLRRPLVHFLVLGAVALAARPWAAEVAARAAGGRERIVIGAERREALRVQLAGVAGREVAETQEREEIERLVDEEILYREALARGVDRDNTIVRERVVESMRALTGSKIVDEEALFQQGVALGIDRSDLVIRRHLAATMRLLVTAPARMEPVRDTDLAALLERDSARMRLPARTSLTHVFVSSRRGAQQAQAAAERMLERLRGGEAAARDSGPMRGRRNTADERMVERDGGGKDAATDADAGDPFMLGSGMRERTDVDLDATFGAGFAAAVAAAPVGTWIGPVRSAYGLHLVRVDARIASEVPSLSAVRESLTARLQHERSQERLRAWLRRKRDHYAVVIEEPRREESTRLAALPVQRLDVPAAAAIVGD
ncbi:MAG TPA: peptidyl-prolyl cis-trans isomerase [Candidatus Limnocylindrales bacterium]|nr:peptidyl-prolyl cis-trans isomerase [Candidatus Limnocylindrales bacterium]